MTYRSGRRRGRRSRIRTRRSPCRRRRRRRRRRAHGRERKREQAGKPAAPAASASNGLTPAAWTSTSTSLCGAPSAAAAPSRELKHFGADHDPVSWSPRASWSGSSVSCIMRCPRVMVDTDDLLARCGACTEQARRRQRGSLGEAALMHGLDREQSSPRGEPAGQLRPCAPRSNAATCQSASRKPVRHVRA